MNKNFNANAVRNEFPMLASQDGKVKPLAFLDSTATTQKPLCVINVMNDFYKNHYSSVKRGVYRLSAQTTEAFERTRKEVANFINAKSENEIIFTRGTTESINLVAWSYGRKFFKQGDEILISGLEHHANIVSWQLIAEEKGAKIKVIPVKDNGDLDIEKLPNLLNSKTKMVAFTHVSNSIGTINPVKEMTKIIRDKAPQTKILIDAAQSVSHLKIDVQSLDCDFLAFSGHKMYGPTGIGVLYGKYDVLNSMPPFHGGGEMIKKVTFEKTTFAEVPARFEAGTPAIAEVIGLGEAIRWLNQKGLENIHQHEIEITEYALQELSKISEVQILGTPKERGALISITLNKISVSDAAMILDEENIAVRSGHHCAEPVMDRFGIDATLRLSFGAYTLKQDIDRFIVGIKRVLKLFS